MNGTWFQYEAVCRHNCQPNARFVGLEEQYEAVARDHHLGVPTPWKFTNARCVFGVTVVSYTDDQGGEVTRVTNDILIRYLIQGYK